MRWTAVGLGTGDQMIPLNSIYGKSPEVPTCVASTSVKQPLAARRSRKMAAMQPSTLSTCSRR